MDIPEAPASPSLCVPPASEHVSSSHVPLYNMGSNGRNKAEAPSLLDYSEGQLAITSSWDGAHQALSIFGTEDTQSKDSKMILKSIKRIRIYIKHHPTDKVPPKEDFILVVRNLWKLIDTIYITKWDSLIFEKEKSLTIRKCVGEYIMPYYKQKQLSTPTSNIEINTSISPPSAETTPPPTINISVAPPPPNKNIESTVKKAPKSLNMKKSYMQASKSNVSYNIEDILRVKEAFPALSVNEVGKMLKIKNSRESSKKPRINMTTRGPSRKEVIIPMTKHIAKLIVNSAHTHISNINKGLKSSKSDIVADFIHITNNGIVITTNKLANDLNLSTIENYLKNIKNVNSDSIESLHLPRSKLYMKIIGLSYKIKQEVISPDYIESILKEIHLFKDVMLASKSHVIKVSLKSDIAVVWVDIWDSQSDSSAKNIINCHFNIGCFITTIKDTNINLGILQYKNCWK